MDIFHERIKPLFEKSGKSDAELEREIGIPPKKINQWTTGYTKSWQKYIPQIAAFFNVSTDYLLGNIDDPAPPGATVNEAASPLPFQLTKESHELLTHFFSLTKAGQDELLHYARFLTSKQADAPMQAKSHLA